MLVAVGNTASYGGGMRICPDADPFDGLLDVTIIHPVGRVKLLRLLPEMFSGQFVRDRVRGAAAGPRGHASRGPGLVGFGDGEMIGRRAADRVASVPRRAARSSCPRTA